MEIKKNLQHGYLFVFGILATIFLISLGIELYLTKDKFQSVTAVEVSEDKEVKNDVEITLESPKSFEPTLDAEIQIKGYLNKNVDLLINEKKVETHRLLGNREYFELLSPLEFGVNKFEFKANGEVIKTIEIERIREDIPISKTSIECTTNQDAFSFGQVIEFKCKGEGFGENLNVSVSICWKDKPEVLELQKDGEFFVGDTVVREKEKQEIESYINFVGETTTAKTNFTFKANQ